MQGFGGGGETKNKKKRRKEPIPRRPSLRLEDNIKMDPR
jgi:hypothetical protein